MESSGGERRERERDRLREQLMGSVLEETRLHGAPGKRSQRLERGCLGDAGDNSE